MKHVQRRLMSRLAATAMRPFGRPTAMADATTAEVTTFDVA